MQRSLVHQVQHQIWCSIKSDLENLRELSHLVSCIRHYMHAEVVIRIVSSACWIESNDQCAIRSQSAYSLRSLHKQWRGLALHSWWSGLFFVSLRAQHWSSMCLDFIPVLGGILKVQIILLVLRPIWSCDAVSIFGQWSWTISHGWAWLSVPILSWISRLSTTDIAGKLFKSSNRGEWARRRECLGCTVFDICMKRSCTLLFPDNYHFQISVEMGSSTILWRLIGKVFRLMFSVVVIAKIVNFPPSRSGMLLRMLSHLLHVQTVNLGK